MDMSQFHFHSWGLVASVQKENKREIKVVPLEVRFGYLESVIDDPTIEEDSYLTDDGEEIVQVIKNTAVTAKWLNFNSNRITTPNVRRNEQVMIYRLGNTDKYYWMDMNVANVKRLETVVYAWSADPRNPMKDDLSNAYFLEISTHDKAVTFVTSQANGEPFGYTLQFNTDNGIVVLKDTDENVVYLDSANTVIGFKNACSTEFRLDKKNIHAYAPDSIYYKAEKTIDFKCTDFNITASKSINFKTNTWNVDSSSEINFKTTKWFAEANTITYKASGVTIQSPTTKCTGLLQCAAISVGGGGAEGDSGGAEIFGHAIFRSGITVTGGITADTITAQKGTFDSHGPH